MTKDGTGRIGRVRRRLGTVVLAGCGVAAMAGVGSATAAEVGPLTRITGGSPFAGCTADNVAGQDGTVYRGTEIEPWVDANPTDPRNLIAGWQQDRWDNGGGRGNPAAVSKDGGASWRIVTLPKASVCTGGTYLRNSDPWVSFSPNGTAYYMHLAFDPDLPSGLFGRNAMLVNRSRDGGLTWGDPVALIRDPAGQALNDKNSLTADPTNPSFAYAVWDRLEDFTIGPAAKAAAGAAAVADGQRPGMDGLALTRERVKRLKAQAKSAAAQATGPVFFKGPTYLARTTNGGRSWEPAKVIYDPGNNRQTIGNIVDVLPNGTVIDFFVDILQNGALRLALLRSTDKGRTFERRPTYIVTVSDSFTGTITPDQLEGVRDANILFSVAVNRRNGRIYIVWQDIRFRGVDEVAFSQSSDGGRTWSAPIRINQTPANRNPLRQQAFIPSVEVAANGTVAVTYYDFRRDNDARELTDHWAVFCRSNCTRRASWGDEVRLTTFPFDMLDAPIARGHFLGDYVGLVAARNVFHPVFGIATRPDVTNLYTRRIDGLGGVSRVASAP